jgi:hypothetical protein
MDRVGLEHHGDAALARRHVVHHMAADRDDAARDFAQAAEQPRQRGLTASTKATSSSSATAMSIPCSTAVRPKDVVTPSSGDGGHQAGSCRRA